MNDEEFSRRPPALAPIHQETLECGFDMASEPKTGALLKVLAASKPSGRLLELGTGTGLGTAWLLSGMDGNSHLDTVDSNPAVVAVAQRHLRADQRVTFHVMDAHDFIARKAPGMFDLIYADAWPGKFSHLEQALSLLTMGGIYFVDDLLPQANWPEGHAARVPALIDELESRTAFISVRLAWASGLMIVVRTG